MKVDEREDEETKKIVGGAQKSGTTFYFAPTFLPLRSRSGNFSLSLSCHSFLPVWESDCDKISENAKWSELDHNCLSAPVLVKLPFKEIAPIWQQVQLVQLRCLHFTCPSS